MATHTTALVTAIALLTAASSSFAQPKSVKMYVAGTSGPTDTQSLGHLELKRRLESASKGFFDVEVKLGGVMGETNDVTEQAREGVPVLNATDPGRIASFVPEYGVIQMPYIFTDYSYLNKIMDTKLHKKWERDFEAKGIKLVTSNGYSGARSWITNMPVRTPADLKGVKLRMPGTKEWVALRPPSRGAKPTRLWSRRSSTERRRRFRASTP